MTTTITITIVINAKAEDVLDKVEELAGAVAELRSGVERLAEEVATGHGRVLHQVKMGATTDPSDDAASEMLRRRLDKMGRGF